MAHLCSLERPQSSEMNSHDISSRPGFDTREPMIQPGDMVLLRLPNGDVRGVKVEKDSCVF